MKKTLEKKRELTAAALKQVAGGGSIFYADLVDSDGKAMNRRVVYYNAE